MKRRLMLACGALAVLMAGAACGDGDDGAAGGNGNPTLSPSTGADDDIAHDRTPAPILDGPASLYTVLYPDLDDDYLALPDRTFELDARSYSQGAAAVFGSAADGEEMLADWGYVTGYETQYEPEGRTTAVLAGRYYVGVETHLFETEDGAHEAYAFFTERLGLTSENAGEPQIGNEASAWTYLPHQTIGSSTVQQIYHRVVFRRGNLVGVVSTLGAEPLVGIDAAIRLAAIVDEKALGERERVEPTPIGQQPNDANGDDDGDE